MASRTDFGPPNYKEMPRPYRKKLRAVAIPRAGKAGVLKHVAESGDELYTVRVGFFAPGQHRLDPDVCAIAGRICGGHPALHQPAQPGIPVSDAAKLEPLIEHLNANGFSVGGTGMPSAPGTHPGLDPLPHTRQQKHQPLSRR